MRTVSTLLHLVKFEHTIFALPFAYAGMLLAGTGVAEGPSRGITALSWHTMLWITVAMVGARTCAMAINRLVDAGIDARNPRTAGREIPSGVIGRRHVAGLILVSGTVLVVATTQLDPITRVLWPIPIALFVIYPYTKRFTWMCHAVLGVSIGLAAPGAWLAVTGEAPLPAWLLAVAVATWIGGFDVIYATQDVEVDRREGLYSLPARFGVGPALNMTRVCHVITVACLAGVGVTCGLGAPYWMSLGLVAALLAWENAIVSPRDLSRVNAAFFTLNGVLGVVYVAGVFADVA